MSKLRNALESLRGSFYLAVGEAALMALSLLPMRTITQLARKESTADTMSMLSMASRHVVRGRR